jgi:protoporphyrinogen IX oxidase
MAGLLYLPRLFVYHADAVKGSDKSETLKLMERRLLKGIMNPAMILSWLAGLWLAWQGGWWKAGWFHGKFALVLLLSGFHGFLSRVVKDFAADSNARSPRFFRFINEVPTLLMIGVVVLVIVKPF